MSKTSKLSVLENKADTKPQQPQIAQKAATRDRSYDHDAFVELFNHRGARDILILDNTGSPMRSTCSQRRTIFYVSNLKPLLFMARNVVRDLDPSNDITFLRIRSNIGEVHITLGTEFILIVVQRFRKKFGTK